MYFGGPNGAMQWLKAMKIRGTKLGGGGGAKKKEKKKKKNNKQRQNVWENYGRMTAKMGGGHLHTDPARQNRQGLDPPPPSLPSIGSVSNDDGDGNENGKKEISLD